MSVVVIDVLREPAFVLTTVVDQHVIETLSTDGADEALGEGVVGECLGRSGIEAPLDFGD